MNIPKLLIWLRNIKQYVLIIRDRVPYLLHYPVDIIWLVEARNANNIMVEYSVKSVCAICLYYFVAKAKVQWVVYKNPQ